MKVLLLTAAMLLSFSVFSDTKQNTRVEYVAVSAQDITPPLGTPLGGFGGAKRRLTAFLDWGNRHRYSTFLKPSEGILDPIRAKALVIRDHRQTLAFVSLDVVGVTLDVYEYVASELKKHGINEVFISATHTHTGPGALSKSWLWQVLAMDKFVPPIYEKFVADIVNTVLMAKGKLEPGSLHHTSFTVEDANRNRRDEKAPVNKEAHILYAKNRKGVILGGLVNFAVHPVSLGQEVLMFSSDVAGGIERHLEQAVDTLQPNSQTPIFMFVNGAEGDVTPAHGGMKGIEKIGKKFGKAIVPALKNSKPIIGQWKVRKIEAKLPRARLSLRNCEAMKWNLKIPIGKRTFPRKALLWQVQLGDVMMLTWPGEPTTQLGWKTEALAKKYGVKNPWVFGLTNGHMAYFTTHEEYKIPGYESCTSIHGEKAGDVILDAHRKIFSM